MIHLIDRIGNTPLLRLEHISRMVGANIFLKYEACNPFGSALDRTAWGYLKQAVDCGELKPGGCVVEASSGNLAISLAHMCAAIGISLFIVMPEPEDGSIPHLLRLLGAEVKITPAKDGMLGAQKLAEYLHSDIWGSFHPNQFYNQEGPRIHYETTGAEILRQCAELNFQPDLFISGVGSGATISGVGRRLRESSHPVSIAAVEPAESPVLSGGKAAPHALRGIGAGFVPSVLNRSLIAHVVPVCAEDAIRACRRLLGKEGLTCGPTTGANLHAALQLAGRKEYRGKNVVIMGHDGLEHHLAAIRV